MPEENQGSKRGKILGYVLIAIGLIAVILIVWHTFFRNPCKKGEKQDPDTGACVSACPPGTSFDEDSELCVQDGNGGPPINGDGVIPSMLGTPAFDWVRPDGAFPRDVIWIFKEEGWSDAYELELLSGPVTFRKEAFLFAPDRLEIFKLDSNGNWVFIWGKDYWGVHDDIRVDLQIALGRSIIKGFKFHLRYGYFKNINVSTI